MSVWSDLRERTRVLVSAARKNGTWPRRDARDARGLTLAAVGLLGILSYVVILRRKEIGIRIALGAHRGSIHG